MLKLKLLKSKLPKIKIILKNQSDVDEGVYVFRLRNGGSLGAFEVIDKSNVKLIGTNDQVLNYTTLKTDSYYRKKFVMKLSQGGQLIGEPLCGEIYSDDTKNTDYYQALNEMIKRAKKNLVD